MYLVENSFLISFFYQMFFASFLLASFSVTRAGLLLQHPSIHGPCFSFLFLLYISICFIGDKVYKCARQSFIMTQLTLLVRVWIGISCQTTLHEIKLVLKEDQIVCVLFDNKAVIKLKFGNKIWNQKDKINWKMWPWVKIFSLP